MHEEDADDGITVHIIKDTDTASFCVPPCYQLFQIYNSYPFIQPSLFISISVCFIFVNQAW